MPMHSFFGYNPTTTVCDELVVAS